MHASAASRVGSWDKSASICADRVDYGYDHSPTEPHGAALRTLGNVLHPFCVYRPTGPRPSTVEQPEWLARQGWEAIQSKRYGEALKSFSAATDLAPAWAGLWYGRGYAEYLLGPDGIAERSLRRSIELDGSRGTPTGSWVSRCTESGESIRPTRPTRPPSGRPRTAATSRPGSMNGNRSSSFRTGSARPSAHFRVLFEGRNDDALARRAVDFGCVRQVVQFQIHG